MTTFTLFGTPPRRGITPSALATSVGPASTAHAGRSSSTPTEHSLPDILGDMLDQEAVPRTRDLPTVEISMDGPAVAMHGTARSSGIDVVRQRVATVRSSAS